MEYMTFLITMNYVYEWLEMGLISPEKFQESLDVMYQKYQIEDVRILYQNKLDIYKDKSVNTLQQGVK